MACWMSTISARTPNVASCPRATRCGRHTSAAVFFDHRRAAVRRRPHLKSEVTTLFRVVQTHTEYGSPRYRGAPKSRVDDFIVATLTSLMRSTDSKQISV